MIVRFGDQGWGPRHQTRGCGRPRPVRRTLGVLLFLLVFMHVIGEDVVGALVDLSLIVFAARLVARCVRRRRLRRRGVDQIAQAGDGGMYLGVGREGRWRLARPERAVLLLGPPRSGKTSAVIIPAALAHQGPVVSTSTKPDVLKATAGARSGQGVVWEFNPCAGEPAAGLRELRWSPVAAARDWDGAMRVARAMVTGAGVGAGTTDQTHWSKRATALLAACLHAAVVDDRGIGAVVGWVLGHQLDEPGAILQRADANLACSVLAGLARTEARERSSICSAAADALDAYSSTAALAAASDPNFDPDQFVTGHGTVFVHAPAELQGLAAPLICGLLSEIRRATYTASRNRRLRGRVLFALDEAANIAPLGELPAIASEGGGQGLSLMASFQDLSQARARWGPAADGFLTVFGDRSRAQSGI